MSGLYAIKVRGEWYLATAVHASDYGDTGASGEAFVWSQYGTKHFGFLGALGDEEFKICLQYGNGMLSLEAALNAKMINLAEMCDEIQDCGERLAKIRGGTNGN